MTHPLLVATPKEIEKWDHGRLRRHIEVLKKEKKRILRRFKKAKERIVELKETVADLKKELQQVQTERGMLKRKVSHLEFFIESKGSTIPSDDSGKWSGEICDRCGRRNVVGFEVSDELWMKVVGDESVVRCLTCFDEEAQEKVVEYSMEDVAFYHVSWSDWVTIDKRIEENSD
jgi:hypothetical protein